MSGKVKEIEDLEGLKNTEVAVLQAQYGKNIFEPGQTDSLLHIIWGVVKEPMFVLLAVGCMLYFILGEISEGFMMCAAMVIVVAISIYQEMKSSKALAVLKSFNMPKVLVIREGREQTIISDELVPGDIMILEEGDQIAADAVVLSENDLSVMESVITGESMPVEKDEQEINNLLYQGTTVNSGKCYARVTATGNQTVLGKLGKSVLAYTPPKTLLQVQINRFVRRLALFGITAFLLIWAVNYFKSGDLINSLLFGLTLAMAAIPEEIPVAFSSFIALGSFHMSKQGIISRQPQTIENLGAVSVICLDKTGTITENKMEVKSIYDAPTQSLIELEELVNLKQQNVLIYATLASEKEPFDTMEKAIWEAYRKFVPVDPFQKLKMVFEYPIQGRPPMMSHVYETGAKKIVAAKGAAERILRICGLDSASGATLNAIIKEQARRGYRVLGVASAECPGDQLPAQQDDFEWTFEGLLALYDPPKKTVGAVIREFIEAGISVKLLTGDYPETALSISEQVGLPVSSTILDGERVLDMNVDELKEEVRKVSIYARMFPEAKLKVIDALKANGEIVAMTGDGVNDGPALKSANIGIAMGKHGTEIAKQAADLILTNDNLENITEAIRQGRKIFNNLKKAVRYIISIHIPIILTAALPLVFGWAYPNIFTPVHVIFLELIMGPTCSIFFEMEPVEEGLMRRPPRKREISMFAGNELSISIVQGLAITAGVLAMYYYYMSANYSLNETRTVVFITLLFSNVFLTFVNRSFTETLARTLRYKNPLTPIIPAASLALIIAVLFIPLMREVFGLVSINLVQILQCLAVALVSVIWFEVYKVVRFAKA